MEVGTKFLSIPEQGHGSEEGGYAGGGIFITNVEPQDPTKVVQKTVDIKPGATIVKTILSDTKNVKVHCKWEGTSEDWVGSVRVNGVTIPDANITHIGGRSFTGHVNLVIDFDGNPDPLKGMIVVQHSSGRANFILAELVPKGPDITNVVFGSLPDGQTELKAGDEIDVTFTFDSSDVKNLQVLNYGVTGGKSVAVELGAGNTFTTRVVVANRGTTLQQLGISAVAYNVFGSAGETHVSTAQVPVNNLYPFISFGAVTYPVGQGAIKNTESAEIAVNHSNADSVNFTGSNVSITDPQVLATSKTVTRVDGDYVVTGTNVTATAVRAANGAVTVAHGLVKIAHAAAVVTCSGPSTRLRSGGNNGTVVQTYNISFTSNQILNAVPSATTSKGSMGPITGSGTNYNASLSIHDDVVKGDLTIGGLSAVNLANVPTTVLSGKTVYTVGGFVKRVITIPGLSRMQGFGVAVSDTAKLRCSNLSAGASGSNNWSYKNTKVDEATKYTITDASGNVSSTGTHWYNLDKANAETNTTGTAQVEIEEVA